MSICLILSYGACSCAHADSAEVDDETRLSLMLVGVGLGVIIDEPDRGILPRRRLNDLFRIAVALAKFKLISALTHDDAETLFVG
jgi:hypothetical protein